MISLNYTIVVQFFLFITLYLILKRILFEPVLKVIQNRDAKIRGTYKDAESLEDQSKSNASKYTEQIARAKAVINDQRKALRDKTIAEANRLLEKARADAGAELDKLKKLIEDEANATRGRLKSEVLDIAKEMATKILGRTVH